MNVTRPEAWRKGKKMPQESVPLGLLVTLKANIPYALPPVLATLYTDAAPTLTTSNTQAFTTSQAVTLTGGAAQLGGAFIKSTSDVLVILKRA